MTEPNADNGQERGSHGALPCGDAFRRLNLAGLDLPPRPQSDVPPPPNETPAVLRFEEAAHPTLPDDLAAEEAPVRAFVTAACARERNLVRRARRAEQAAAEALGTLKDARRELMALGFLAEATATSLSHVSHEVEESLAVLVARVADLGAVLGLTAFAPEVGDAIDPHCHCVVSCLPARDGQAPGTIARVQRRGYRAADQIAAPALVDIVARG